MSSEAHCFYNADVAHIYRKFFGQLPFAAEEFVSFANKHLPYIIDTKVLLNSSDILKYWMRKSKTSLSSSFVRLCPQIALGYMSTNLASKNCVRVEVHVDDVRLNSLISSFLTCTFFSLFIVCLVLIIPQQMSVKMILDGVSY